VKPVIARVVAGDTDTRPSATKLPVHVTAAYAEMIDAVFQLSHGSGNAVVVDAGVGDVVVVGSVVAGVVVVGTAVVVVLDVVVGAEQS